MNVFQKFSETIFTPKEWFLSKKGLKEGERVAQGHFLEKVGETPVYWLPPGVGPIPKPFSVSESKVSFETEVSQQGSGQSIR